MKRVLIITYYWPPGAGPGVQRWLKFCKYLGKFDWEPIVLTVRNGSYPSMDPSLAQDVPPEMAIHRTRTFEPFSLYNALKGKKGKESTVGMIGFDTESSLLQRTANYIRANFFVPDARKGWYPHAIKRANRIIGEVSVDAMITTGPPHSTHLIGQTLKKRYGLPWLADFRDPWVNVYYNKFFPRTDSTVRRDQGLEDSVLKRADVVSVVSPGLKAEFQDRARDIQVLYNGYDAIDIEGSAVQVGGKFCISYIGNFKPNQNVLPLWRVLGQLCRSDQMFKNDLQIRLVGNTDASVVKALTENGLEQQVSVEPFVEHAKAVELMKSASLLLFVVPQVKDNHLILTGKLFEYMATGTPMLSIGPPKGNAAELIQECGRGVMLDYNDETGMTTALQQGSAAWRSNSGLEKLEMNERLKSYSRLGQTRKLVEILNNAVGNGND